MGSFLLKPSGHTDVGQLSLGAKQNKTTCQPKHTCQFD